MLPTVKKGANEMIERFSTKRQGKVLVEFTQEEYWELMDMYSDTLADYRRGQVYRITEPMDREHILSLFQMYQALKTARIV